MNLAFQSDEPTGGQDKVGGYKNDSSKCVVNTILLADHHRTRVLIEDSALPYLEILSLRR